MPQATRWVKLTLPLPSDSRCLLRMRRFSSRVRTGMVRMEVAVGTERLASMFSTIRMAPPRIGWAMSPGRMAGMTRAFDRPRDATLVDSLRVKVPARAGSCATTFAEALPPSSPLPREGGSDGTPRALSK